MKVLSSKFHVSLLSTIFVHVYAHTYAPACAFYIR